MASRTNMVLMIIMSVVVFYFMAAMHPDYHQPSDELSKINWDKMKEMETAFCTRITARRDLYKLNYDSARCS